MRIKSQVIIIGAGPTGLVLAHLLGQKGIQVVLIEKDQNIYPIPRATHLDAETLRNFQMTGLMSQLQPFIQDFGCMDIVDDKGKKILEEAVVEVNTAHFYTTDSFFDQVAFEKILRKGLSMYLTVRFLVQTEAIQMIQYQDFVRLTVKNNVEEKTEEIEGNCLVGCDGAKSWVRENVFSEMKELSPSQNWILVDTVLKNKEDAALLPNRFRYYLDKERLTAFAKGFGLNRRWEFELKVGEEMPEEATIQSWIKKFIDLDKLTFFRIKKYTHLSLIAEEWRNNNVFLAGDAAHLMPPFAGQGLCSGIRDAVNLAWKLGDVIQHKASPVLLNTYQTERQAQIRHTFWQTHFLRQNLAGSTFWEKYWRKKRLQFIHQLPALKPFIKKIFHTPKPLSKGCISQQAHLSGRHIPQFLLSENQLTDDVLAYQWCLIYLPNVFEKEPIMLLHTDLFLVPSSNIWEEWLKKNKVDFAVIRPDKIIFGAGKIKQWQFIYHQYQNWKI
jgi:3-(3-hydroxy-phenyl)propionate hydroxylase